MQDINKKEFKVKQAQIMTEFSKQIDYNNILGEYPRPQMQRKDWINLNGIWEFEKCNLDDEISFNKSLSRNILVPFPWEASLSGIMEYVDTCCALYRRNFKLPEAFKGKKIIINFGAVDYEAQIYINGRQIGVHKGGYDAFSYDITEYISYTDENEIIAKVTDLGDKTGQPHGKQANDRWNNPYGVSYIGASGIWQTVWIEAVPNTYIENIVITPNVDNSSVSIRIDVVEAVDKLRVQAVIKDGNIAIAAKNGNPNEEFEIKIEDVKLWSFDNPFLYNLEIHLIRNARKLDWVSSYFGMRKIEVADIDGFKRILLNGKVIFQNGTLDQGFWPDGIYTAPSDEAIKWEIESMKELGYNMVRKHVKVEPYRWYYWCDKLGILVWQDMPHRWKAEEMKEQYKIELERMIKEHYNSPSIILWSVFNEGWGEFDTINMTTYAKSLDNTRLITSNSGYNCSEDIEIGDVKDLHNYLPPKCPALSINRALVCGEYGSLGYIVSGHLWGNNGPYHGLNTSSIDDATKKLEEFSELIIEQRDKEGLCAAVYTQWTDVENEINGIYTYDRKVIKFDKDKLKAINKKILL